MNASLFRRKRRRNGKLFVSAFWSIKYQLDGETRYRVHKLRVREKQVAQQLLAEFVREKESEAYGMIPPAALREAAAKPISEHLSDFVADLKGRNKARMYVYNVEHRVKKLQEECGWHLVKDVTADSFVAWRKSQTKAAKTLNQYLDSASVLLNWMKRQGRCVSNPLAVVGRVDERGQQVRKARALADDEVVRLLAAAPGRKALYLTALLSGLRRSELKALRWGDVHLDTPRPYLSVRASTTKNRKAATIWLRDDLVAELLAVRPADVGDGVAVFARVPKMKEFRQDLAAAEISQEKDSQGREVFFHSLRHTLATNLARGGVAPRVAMELMRHSEMRLTMTTYTDAALLPMVDALDRLPRFESTAVKHGAATACQNVAEVGTQKGTQTTARGCPGESAAVQIGMRGGSKDHSEKPSRSRSESAAVCSGPIGGKSWGTRIRT